MYCKKCGNQVTTDSKFCEKCGNSLQTELSDIQSYQEANLSLDTQQQTISQNQQDSNENISYQNSEYNKINSSPKKKDLGKFSKIIGIISIVLVFLIQILVIPLAIVGLIFGLKYKKQTNKTNIGMILSLISIILAVPVYMFYSNWLFNPVNPVVGTWNCGTLENSKNYTITLKLNRNKTFIWNKYGDEKNNYVKGKFEFKDLEKTNENSSFFFYSIKLNGDKFVSNGQLQDKAYKSQYEMGVGTTLSKADGQAVMINVNSYNIYYCQLEK